MEFVIGVSRMYVLKDIYEFVGNMNRNREFTYGQKLRFLHTRQAFAPDSVEMVNFVINWARRNESMYAQYSVDGTREYAKVRALPIKGEDLEELLIAADGRTITAQVGREGERDWLIAEGWPKLTLTFTGSLDGMEVQMGDCCSVNGNRYRIFFSEGTVYLVSKTEGDPAEKFIDCLEGLPEKKAYIQRRDIPLFGREFLPHLEKNLIVLRKILMNSGMGF